MEIFVPGADWRRLYSAQVDHPQHPVDHGRVVAGRDQFVAPPVAVDVGDQDRVQHLVVGQRVGVQLAGAQLGAAAAW